MSITIRFLREPGVLRWRAIECDLVLFAIDRDAMLYTVFNKVIGRQFFLGSFMIYFP